MKFVGQGLCKDVLAYPLLSASVYRFCSSVPEFVVSLPSVHASRQTTLRLTNRLHQLACERLALSGISRYLRYLCPCWAHTMAIKHMLYCRFLKCVLVNFGSNAGQRCRYLHA